MNYDLESYKRCNNVLSENKQQDYDSIEWYQHLNLDCKDKDIELAIILGNKELIEKYRKILLDARKEAERNDKQDIIEAIDKQLKKLEEAQIDNTIKNSLKKNNYYIPAQCAQIENPEEYKKCIINHSRKF